MKPRHVLVVVAWWCGYICKADMSTVEGGADTQKHLQKDTGDNGSEAVCEGGGARERNKERQ